MHKKPLAGIISSGRNYQRRLTVFCFSSFLYHSLLLAVPPGPLPGEISTTWLYPVMIQYLLLAVSVLH